MAATESGEDVVPASVLREGAGGGSRSEKGAGTSFSQGACEDAADDFGLLVGTIAMFSAILLGIFLVHVAVISGVEAYWLAKVRQSMLGL